MGFAGKEKFLFGVILMGRSHRQASPEGLGASGMLGSLPAAGRRYLSQGSDSVWAAFLGLGRKKFGLFKVHLEAKKHL